MMYFDELIISLTINNSLTFPLLSFATLRLTTKLKYLVRNVLLIRKFYTCER